MFKKVNKPKPDAKVIDIEAGVEGNLKFSTPVNLRISGTFEGELDIRGNLAIGEKADVKAKIIKGENITIAGKVRGDVVSSRRLELFATAKVIGNIKVPLLIISEGAMLKGRCEMPIDGETSAPKENSKRRERSNLNSK